MPRPFKSHFLTLLFSFVLILIQSSTGKAAASGPPITDNNYSVDLSHGVVVGPARKVALGGAYTAIAEGVESLSDNPAGVAYRHAYSKGSWDWDGSLGWFPLGNSDFNNSGSDTTYFNSH